MKKFLILITIFLVAILIVNSYHYRHEMDSANMIYQDSISYYKDKVGHMYSALEIHQLRIKDLNDSLQREAKNHKDPIYITRTKIQIKNDTIIKLINDTIIQNDSIYSIHSFYKDEYLKVDGTIISRDSASYATLDSLVINADIYNDIIQKGGIISELMPGTQPKACFFPMRNRIISGFSDAVIVVEAREKSGSLITADFAMEQGKDVFALPGRITDPLSAGTNRLIKQGAGVLYNIEDFLKEWDLFDASSALQMDFRKNVLEKDELLVYSLLDFCPVGIGTLCDKSSLPILTLFEILERLQQKGFVKEIIPNYFVQTV